MMLGFNQLLPLSVCSLVPVKAAAKVACSGFILRQAERRKALIKALPTPSASHVIPGRFLSASVAPQLPISPASPQLALGDFRHLWRAKPRFCSPRRAPWRPAATPWDKSFEKEPDFVTMLHSNQVELASEL